MTGALDAPSYRGNLLIAPGDPRLTWQGVVSVEQGDGYVKPWRIPHLDLPLYPEALHGTAEIPYGARLSFQSDTTVVAGRIEPVILTGLAESIPSSATIDLYCNGMLHASDCLVERSSFRFENLPTGIKHIEIWLPQWIPFRLYGLELSSGASLEPYDDHRPRWIAYGSSLTKAYPPVEHPSQTWTAQVARKWGFNLLCLGYASGCHLEPMMALMIRDLPADFITLEVALNAITQASLNRRTFAANLTGFVRIVREGHPTTPIVVQSPVFVPRLDASDAAQKKEFSLSDMRAETATTVSKLQMHGDRYLHYVDGLRIYGPEYASFSPDTVHPNTEGQQIIAKSFLEIVVPFFVR